MLVPGCGHMIKDMNGSGNCYLCIRYACTSCTSVFRDSVRNRVAGMHQSLARTGYLKQKFNKTLTNPVPLAIRCQRKYCETIFSVAMCDLQINSGSRLADNATFADRRTGTQKPVYPDDMEDPPWGCKDDEFLSSCQKVSDAGLHTV